MKRFLALFMFFAVFSICSTLFAQTAKVVSLKGAVLVKMSPAAKWQTAKLSMLLNKNCEVETKIAAECILAFDEELKNVLTIKEKSHIKLESVKPGKISLPQGRVFSLIDNISKIEKFEIRTPTAVAGARGTGWETEFRDNLASIACFEDTIEVDGIDEQGNITETKEVDSGLELQISAQGRLGETAELSAERIHEWNEVRNNIESVRESAEQERAKPEAASAADAPSEESELSESGDLTSEGERSLGDEGRENVREQITQEDRRQESTTSSREEQNTSSSRAQDETVNERNSINNRS